MSKNSAAKKVEAPAAKPAQSGTLGPYEMTKAQKEAVAKLDTVSARIRYLNAQGLTRSEISRAIPNAKGGKLIYQHVNNVLNQKLKGKTATK